MAFFIKEMLEGTTDVSYESMLRFVEQNYHPTDKSMQFSEEILIENSSFIIDQSWLSLLYCLPHLFDDTLILTIIFFC